MRTGRAGPCLRTAARAQRAPKRAEQFVRLEARRSPRTKSGGGVRAYTCRLGRGALIAFVGACPMRRAR
eukprot:10866543-Alexandrium_andersonii.AAC.1